MNEGDANTRYFHISSLIQRRFNAIEFLVLPSGHRITDRMEIGHTFVNFFSALFCTTNPVFPPEYHYLISPTITASDNAYLDLIPDLNEIWEALVSMGFYKSLGPDGFNPLFFKTYWQTVQQDVVTAVQFFFQHGRLTGGLNRTFITLIPNIEGATRVEQFRPISLCNVSFKLITKVLATRLRTVLERVIAPHQSAFVPNRNITDNTILNHEIMHHLNLKKGKVAYMALKIDMAKAYDRVEWHILLQLLHLHGFSPHFCDLIRECLSTTSFSVLLNGAPFGTIDASRGIRQGDPLSPALFTFLFHLLSRIRTNAELAGQLQGIKVSVTGPTISHLMYADDLVIYGRATREEATVIHDCLAQFCSWTGQEVNLQKLAIHFSQNAPPTSNAIFCTCLIWRNVLISPTILVYPSASRKPKSRPLEV